MADILISQHFDFQTSFLSFVPENAHFVPFIEVSAHTGYNTYGRFIIPYSDRYTIILYSPEEQTDLFGTNSGYSGMNSIDHKAFHDPPTA